MKNERIHELDKRLLLMEAVVCDRARRARRARLGPDFCPLGVCSAQCPGREGEWREVLGGCPGLFQPGFHLLPMLPSWGQAVAGLGCTVAPCHMGAMLFLVSYVAVTCVMLGLVSWLFRRDWQMSHVRQDLTKEASLKGQTDEGGQHTQEQGLGSCGHGRHRWPCP